MKIRKLAEQKSLSQDLIIAALDRGAIELFLEKVNPLDQAVRARAGKPPDEIDQRFFRALLQRYPADADGSEVMATDEPAAPS